MNHYSGCITDKIDEYGVAVGLPEVTGFKNNDGMGLSGKADDHLVCVGNLDLMESFGIKVEDREHSIIRDWSEQGCTVILVGIDGKVRL